ncbi:MAG: hypothetical protein ACHQZR_00495 [Candidatus Limnocylindrales bacterium]
MTTQAERRDFRAAIERNRIWTAETLLDALVEEMDDQTARRWLRNLRAAAEDAIDRRTRLAAMNRPGTSPVDCNRCGRLFWAGSRARYCSSVCRQQAYRQRMVRR